MFAAPALKFYVPNLFANKVNAPVLRVPIDKKFSVEKV